MTTSGDNVKSEVSNITSQGLNKKISKEKQLK